MIDTNVVLDVLLKRTAFFEPSYEVLKLASIGQIDGYVSASAVTDVYYVLHRTNNDKTASLHAIRDLLRLVKIADIKNDFTQSPVPVLSPQAFIKQFRE